MYIHYKKAIKEQNLNSKIESLEGKIISKEFKKTGKIQEMLP